MRHEIKTLVDILEVVNENNLENFTEDFKTYLQTMILIKGFSKSMSSEEFLRSTRLIWIDDGKHDATVRITSKKRRYV